MPYTIDVDAQAIPRQIAIGSSTTISFVASEVSGSATCTIVTYTLSGSVHFVRPEGKVRSFRERVAIGAQTQVTRPVTIGTDSPPASGVYEIGIEVEAESGTPGAAFTQATITVL
jgi:hypothetical protein